MRLQTALHDVHVAAGARMVPFGGWNMPVQYRGGIIAEHQAVREAAGLFDLSHMGRLYFASSAGRRLLQWLSTNNVESLAAGRAQYGLLCNESGRILDDTVAYNLGEDLLLVVNASNRPKLLEWIAHQRASRARRDARRRHPGDGHDRAPGAAGRGGPAAADRARPAAAPLLRRRAGPGCESGRPGGQDGLHRGGWLRADRVGGRRAAPLADAGRARPAGSADAVRAWRPRHAPPRGRHAALRPRDRRADHAVRGQPGAGRQAGQRGVRRPGGARSAQVGRSRPGAWSASR